MLLILSANVKHAEEEIIATSNPRSPPYVKERAAMTVRSVASSQIGELLQGQRQIQAAIKQEMSTGFLAQSDPCKQKSDV